MSRNKTAYRLFQGHTREPPLGLHRSAEPGDVYMSSNCVPGRDPIYQRVQGTPGWRALVDGALDRTAAQFAHPTSLNASLRYLPKDEYPIYVSKGTFNAMARRSREGKQVRLGRDAGFICPAAAAAKTAGTALNASTTAPLADVLSQSPEQTPQEHGQSVFQRWSPLQLTHP